MMLSAFCSICPIISLNSGFHSLKLKYLKKTLKIPLILTVLYWHAMSYIPVLTMSVLSIYTDNVSIYSMHGIILMHLSEENWRINQIYWAPNDFTRQASQSLGEKGLRRIPCSPTKLYWTTIEHFYVFG